MSVQSASPRGVEFQASGPLAGSENGQAEHELVLSFHGVTDREVRSVELGTAELALVVEPPLIVFCCRFGDAIPWSRAAYHWRQLAHSGPIGQKSRTSLMIRLIEAEDGTVRARRSLGLSRGLVLAWDAAIGLQTARHCSEARYAAALTQFFLAYPYPDDVLARAIAVSRDACRAGRTCSTRAEIRSEGSA